MSEKINIELNNLEIVTIETLLYQRINEIKIKIKDFESKVDNFTSLFELNMIKNSYVLIYNKLRKSHNDINLSPFKKEIEEKDV